MAQEGSSVDFAKCRRKYRGTRRCEAGLNAMEKLKVIVSAIVAIGLASILLWQHFSNESLRQDNEGLQQSLAALKQLSDVSAPAATEQAMGEEQKGELLKLRTEVAQLRTQTFIQVKSGYTDTGATAPAAVAAK